MVLRKITPDTVREYLIERKETGLLNATLNMERGAIIRVMKLHKRYRPFIDELKPLRVQASTIGRALTDDEQSILLLAALSRSDTKKLRCAVVLALNTTMRSVELKHLHWQDVDLLERVISVRRSKTEAGKRAVPLNDAAFAPVLNCGSKRGKKATACQSISCFPPARMEILTRRGHKRRGARHSGR